MAPNAEATLKDFRSDDSDDIEEQDNEKKIEYATEEERIAAEIANATWGEVYEACCVHSASEWGMIALGIFLVLFFLYWFMFALKLLGNSAKVLTGCTAGSLFGDSTNPAAGVMMGTILTVLLDSSSTTTSIIVSLTGTVLTLDQAIYMVMGCNIGTTLTNTIVACAHLGDHDQLERAFAGATVHDMFNYMTVMILLPLEVSVHYLNRLTGLMVRNASTSDGEEWEGPLKKIVDPLAERIIKSNSKLISAVAKQKATCNEGDGFYPIICDPGTPTYESCSQVGLISCNKDSNTCPLMFSPTATIKDDKVSGGVMIFLAVCLLFICLGFLVAILAKMLAAVSHRVIYKATSLNGYILIAIGCGLTMLVQSSSVMTSALTPLVGAGALRIEQMYPLTLGSNIGTTITGLMAAMVQEGTLPLQVALCHLMFNVTGIVIYYPIPFMRFPIRAARFLGRMTQLWRGFPFLYIALAFLIFPLIILGLSALFAADQAGYTLLGAFFSIVLGVWFILTVYNLRYRGGWERWLAYFAEREKRRRRMEDLPTDLDYLKEKVALLLEQSGVEKTPTNMTNDNNHTDKDNCSDEEAEA